LSKIKNERIPIPISQNDMMKKIKEMLRQAEDQAQKFDEKEDLKADQSLSGLCPFTFETIWNLIENNQEDDRNLSLENLVPNFLFPKKKLKISIQLNMNFHFEKILGRKRERNRRSFLY
jgi:hypothetical protein